MKKINKNNYELLINGSLFYGTGGGGHPSEAKEIFEKLFVDFEFIELVSEDELKDSDLIVTAFGVGSSNIHDEISLCLQNARKLFEDILKRKISVIIPVEIGPKALATAAYFAAQLGVPLLDADIVGGRSAPEIYLETITLKGIERTPCVLANSKGDTCVLMNSTSHQVDETFMRNFAMLSNDQALVLGYPLSKSQIVSSVEHGTISDSIKAGELLTYSQSSLICSTGAKFKYAGKIQNINIQSKGGFFRAEVIINNNENNIGRLIIKNEYLSFYINNSISINSPDSIIIFDKSGFPQYASDLTVGMDISVYSLLSRPLWNTPMGKKLWLDAMR